MVSMHDHFLDPRDLFELEAAGTRNIYIYFFFAMKNTHISSLFFFFILFDSTEQC